MAAAGDQLQLNLITDYYPEAVIDVGKMIFGEDQRKIKHDEVKMKVQERNKKDNSRKSNKEIENETSALKKELTNKLERQTINLTQAACALLNSGGGVIRAEIENEGYSYKRHRIGLDIEKIFRECIQSDPFSQYFDAVQEGSCMLIWVKTWSSENLLQPAVISKARLCCLDSGLFQRSGTSVVKMKPLEALQFLKTKKVSAKQVPPKEAEPPWKRLCVWNNNKHSRAAGVQDDEDILKAAAQFFERSSLEYGEFVDFTESIEVEFKAFPKDKDPLEFLRAKLPDYISGFANTKGGYLFFGVRDNGEVIGYEGNLQPSQLEIEVQETIEILPHFHFCTSLEKVTAKCKIMPVYGPNGTKHGYVFAVRVEPFCCVVFVSAPDSWIVEDCGVKKLQVDRWIELMTADQDLSKLSEQFSTEVSLSDGPPMIKPVYSVRGLDSLDVLRRNIFPESNRMTFLPQPLCDKLLKCPRLKALLEKEIDPQVQGTLMFSYSWAVDIGLPKNEDIVCDALLMAAGCYPVLYTIVENPTSDVYEHSRRTARLLKQKLVNVGGYTQKICVIPKVLNLRPTHEQNAGDQRWQYPKTYMLCQEHLPSLQKALVTVMLGFTSFLSDFIGVEFLNLLTLEQYGKLSKKLDETRLQFIYGIPGSGKTVVALKIMEKIKNEFGCQPDEILYICENKPLRMFVSKKVCHAVTRATFMLGEFPNVKHIVVDEAQNFRVENGRWYRKARNIVNRDSNSPGIFWIFLDYFQMSHPYPCGLPPPSRQYPKDYLTKGVRNASTIYNTVKSEMEKIVEAKQLKLPYPQLRMLLDKACCSNSVAGCCQIKVEMEGKEIANYVARQCRMYLDTGYSQKDIAILCSTREQTSYYQRLLVEGMRKLRLDVDFVEATEILAEKIVLDSIRRFSGLERPIVFGIDPVPTQEEVSRNLLLCVASRANKQLHLLYAKEQVLQS